MRAITILFSILFLTGEVGPVQAQISGRDREAFKQIIEAQINAFRDNDAEKAFSYAVPALKKRFGTAERFMKVVRDGYPAIFLPRQYLFGDVTGGSERPTQRVRLVGPHGHPWLALYGFERKGYHGTWKITGVTLQPLDQPQIQKVFPSDDDEEVAEALPAVGARLSAALSHEGGGVRFAASFDTETGKIEVVKIGEQSAEDKDFELWLINGDKPPVSLGLVDGKDLKAPAVPAKLQSEFKAGAKLAISIEPRGGSTTGAPTGPVIASGPIRKQ